MNLKRFWIIFVARNREFFRDRAAFGWNFLFPFLIIAGFGIIFNENEYNDFKVGFFSSENALISEKNPNIPARFRETRYLTFIQFNTFDEGFKKLSHHKIDFLLNVDTIPYKYWISNSSPKGYIVENIFLGSLSDPKENHFAEKIKIQGRKIRYIDWLFPGVLSMNMMFSALWGVGFVVVRYRKNGVLKRLQATPLTAFEYLTAQMVSRIFLLMFTLFIMWVGCYFLFSINMEGSHVDLMIVFLAGSLSLSSLGLLLASRGTSEEFTTGILNFISWPMMFLSEVWFSIEGAPQWVKSLAQILPLTHMIGASRKIINDGAMLKDVSIELTFLLITTLIFLVIGASLFSWNK